MLRIQLKKINHNYESDPNIAEPIVKLHNNELSLYFRLNSFSFNFQAGQKGCIKFNDCFALRIGAPNDEGFDLNTDSFWKREQFLAIQWNSFYEVIDKPSISYLQKFYKLSERVPPGIHHYVFFMKEATFECLATSFNEIF